MWIVQGLSGYRTVAAHGGERGGLSGADGAGLAEPRHGRHAHERRQLAQPLHLQRDRGDDAPDRESGGGTHPERQAEPGRLGWQRASGQDR